MCSFSEPSDSDPSAGIHTSLSGAVSLTVSKRSRLIIAAIAGVAGTLLAAVLPLARQHDAASANPGGDFRVPLVAAQALLRGDNPYAAIHAQATAGDPGAAFYYPLPAALVAIPFTPLPRWLAGALFFGLSSAGLAWVITRNGYDRLPLFFSTSFLFSAAAAQWSPFLMAVSLVPALQGFLLVKPNLGAALFLLRPGWKGVAGGLALVALSFVLQPTWLADWLSSFGKGATIFHRPPIVFSTFGAVLLLAGLRWRRPEARLLLLMSCVPQFPFFYDQLPLWFIPQTRREALNLTWCSFAAFGAWLAFSFDWKTRNVVMSSAAPWVLALLYVPCLIMVLRKPNVSPMASTASEAA